MTKPERWFWYTSVLLLASCVSMFGQNDRQSRLRVATVALDTSWQVIDSLTIWEPSVELTDERGLELPSATLEVNNRSVRLSPNFWSGPDRQRVRLTYRVLPVDLGAPISYVDQTTVDYDLDSNRSFFKFEPFAEPENPLASFEGLDYRGSFSRGISFGNNQSLVLNSAFNLQMAGELGSGVLVKAAITDENIPIQPDGNTRQLNEFDQVYVSFSKDSNELVVGDYEMLRPQSYFLNYYKKVQGARIATHQQIGETHLKASAGAALARGKFVRNIINPQEGNQGPYRLQGADGEQFIILIAGTEKVFLDGQQLQRGAQDDYIIDYNRGDVVFSPNRLITKDSRIIIEFEYVDQNYSRTLYAADVSWQGKNSGLEVHLYGDQDSRQPVDAPFSETQQTALRDAGDAAFQALTSSIDTVEEYSAFRVQYALTDTVFCNESRRILRYSTDPAVAKFVAQFTEVGAGNGDYVLDTQTAANGRVFTFVAPVDCESQGNYAALQPVAPPQQQQVLTIGGRQEVDGVGTFGFEVGLSNQDLNRISPIDDGDNDGLAILGTWENEWKLDTAGGWKLSADAKVERISASFRTLNPYRPAEFTREWALANLAGGQLALDPQTTNEEIWTSSGIGLTRRKWGNVRYQLGTFDQTNRSSAVRHQVSSVGNRQGWDWQLNGDWLTAERPFGAVDFWRPNARLTKTFDQKLNLQIGGIYEQERNLQRDSTDLLLPTSFAFERYEAFIGSRENDTLTWKLTGRQRTDEAPALQNELGQSALAREVTFEGKWQFRRKAKQKFHSSQLNYNLTVRDLQIQDSVAVNQDAGTTYLGRLQHQLALWGGFMRHNTTYEIASGQERQIQFTYLQVPVGEGNFFWQDRNEDGVVQFDEVEVAVFQNQGNAIRVVTFTNEFVPTNNVQFSYTFNLDPRVLWYQETGWKKTASRFSVQSSIQINRKVRGDAGLSPWNPFQLDVADTALIATTAAFRNVLFINRGDPKWELQFGQLDNRNKLVQTTGFESRFRTEWFTQYRRLFADAWTLVLDGAIGQRGNFSEQFGSRTFELDVWRFEPRLTYQPAESWRLEGRYEWQRSDNQLGEEALRGHSAVVEATINQSTKSVLRGNVELVWNRYSGVVNSPVGFALLEGLQPGRNLLWNIAYERQLGGNVRLNITYEGRQPGDDPVVHTGRAQVIALF